VHYCIHILVSWMHSRSSVKSATCETALWHFSYLSKKQSQFLWIQNKWFEEPYLFGHYQRKIYRLTDRQFHFYRVGQKNGLLLRWDNFATTNDRKVCNTSEVSELLCRMKCIICMSVQLNIMCQICINHQCPKNCIEYQDAWVSLNFHSKYSETWTIS